MCVSFFFFIVISKLQIYFKEQFFIRLIFISAFVIPSMWFLSVKKSEELCWQVFSIL